MFGVGVPELMLIFCIIAPVAFVVFVGLAVLRRR